MSKDRRSTPPTSAVTFQGETTAIFTSFPCRLMLTFWAVREQAEQMEAFSYATWNVLPLSPTHCRSVLKEWCNLCHSPETSSHMIHCKHTGNSTSNSLPRLRNKYMEVKHGTSWRKIMVSFIFMKQVMSTWRESLRVITKWWWAHKRLPKGSAKPSPHTVSDGGKRHFLQ